MSAQKIARMGSVRIGDTIARGSLCDGRMRKVLNKTLKRGHDPELSAANRRQRIKRIWMKWRQGKLSAAVASTVRRDYRKFFDEFERELRARS